MRVILIGGILMLTAPVSPHVIARGAYVRERRPAAEEFLLEFADDVPPWRL